MTSLPCVAGAAFVAVLLYTLAGGGLSAARTVAFARGEAIIVERCMRHDSRQRVRELLAER